jgi:hypothetical protein
VIADAGRCLQVENRWNFFYPQSLPKSTRTHHRSDASVRKIVGLIPHG